MRSHPVWLSSGHLSSLSLLVMFSCTKQKGQGCQALPQPSPPSGRCLDAWSTAEQTSVLVYSFPIQLSAWLMSSMGLAMVPRCDLWMSL